MDYDAHSISVADDNTFDPTTFSVEPAVEVTVLWETQVLHLQHLPAPYGFTLGQPSVTPRRLGKPARDVPAGFLLPEEVLERSSTTLVTTSTHGPAVLLGDLPPTAELRFQDQETFCPVADVVAAARASGYASQDGGSAYWPLNRGAVEIRLGAFRVMLCITTTAKPMPRALFSTLDSDQATYYGLSFLSAAALLLSAAFFTPPLALTAAEGLDRDELILMQQYLDAAAEREQEQRESTAEAATKSSGGESGQKSEKAEGAMGDTQSVARNKRYQVQGPRDNPDPHLARQAALQDAINFGAVGLLSSMTSDPNAPTAPWGHETALGLDASSANGVMWADEFGTAFGAGGLALSGLGDGGGGQRQGIGVGDVGTFNRGMGSGGDYSFGAGHGRLPGSHQVKVPVTRTGNPTISGRLPPQTIQRVVRQNHGRFRLCYERGLGANPSLEGRVNVRFVIGRNGAVTNVANGGSSMPSAEVVNCVVRAFYGLSFPKPEGGLVTVSYPLSFSPG